MKKFFENLYLFVNMRFLYNRKDGLNYNRTHIINLHHKI